MLAATYHMRNDATLYHDLDAGHFDRRAKGAAAKCLIAQVETLAHDVPITPLAARTAVGFFLEQGDCQLDHADPQGRGHEQFDGKGHGTRLEERGDCRLGGLRHRAGGRTALRNVRAGTRR
jgi:hypothetical protein